MENDEAQAAKDASMLPPVDSLLRKLDPLPLVHAARSFFSFFFQKTLGMLHRQGVQGCIHIYYK